MHTPNALLSKQSNQLEPLERLQKKLNYHFSDIHKLSLALQHRSYHRQNNERLEFLGDSVLDLIITDYLFTDPKLNEGDFSRTRSNLVKEESLSLIAKALELQNYIKLGAGELKTDGALKASILADCLEAIIGAMYIDSNLQTITPIVLNWFTPFFQQLQFNNQKDAKTKLQEILQSRKLNIPVYTLINTCGPAHAQTFLIRCSITQPSLNAEAQAMNKKQAEQQAASLLLSKLQDLMPKWF